jgi:hypothetical protein
MLSCRSIRWLLAFCVTAGQNILFVVADVAESTATATASACFKNDSDGEEESCPNTEAARIAQPTIDCGVYMAPSTIGNHSNLGIYTGKTMKKGDVVPYGEILIPFLWRTFKKHPKSSLTDGQLWDRYIWEQYIGEMEPFDDLLPNKEKASCFFPGVGCTVNSMLDLSNIKSVKGSEFDEVVNRMTSPGAGAFTPYHSARTIIKADQVNPGQELFASYGDEWIPWIPGVAVTQDGNFEIVDELMNEFEDWIEEHEGPDCSSSGELTSELLEGMWKFMVDFPLPSRPLSVLPKEWSRDVLRKASIKGKQREVGNMEPESPSRAYWVDKGMVTLEFLQTNGKCQDHIRPDISTVPDAGRGAFATRDLPMGTVVGYAPLVHVAIRGEEVFTVSYDGTKHGTENHVKEPFSKPDLVLNYSFGHRNSTIILTPYGGMVNYINHKGVDDGDGPNVRIQWPGKELVAHKPAWLKKDVTFLRDTIDKIGLSFDYVALRDIKEGEEVFMDYGHEWVRRMKRRNRCACQNDFVKLKLIKSSVALCASFLNQVIAWEKHVDQWKPPQNEEGYIHSSLFNVEYLRTERELETHPYPWNLLTLCSDSFTKKGNIFKYSNSTRKSGEKFPCIVLERKKVHETHDSDTALVSMYLYTVEVDHKGKKFVIHNVPREENGVELVDKAYSQMWHMKNAFRNKMYIPDDIFPPSWINLPEDSNLLHFG